MFSQLKALAGWVKISSVVIALILPAIILAPLPGVMIDVFVLFGFIMSAMILVIMLENDNPLKVTFLPTIVLLLTTFRLILSIATTRNILANDDVGQVIEVVGHFAMSAGLLSGLIVFIIITIVQFLVVTKGGERVAEVGARFSLDALPGRQMTIDGDLKNNMITPEQARTQRAELSTENKLFGALEGAMKFIKGDAIAGILISLVNLFGGIYIGISQFELTFSESVERFSILTIGDGLVSQIPSLLLSIACGVYLTRIKGVDEKTASFASQLVNQIGTFWRSLVYIGLFLLIIGILDTELISISTPIALTCFSIAFILWKKQKNVAVISIDGEGSGLFASLTFILKENKHQYLIYDVVKDIENQLWGQELGMPKIIINPNLGDDIEVSLMGISLYRFSQNENNGGIVREIQGDGIFVQSEFIENNLKVIFSYFIRQRLNEKYNIQFTSNILDDLSMKSEVMKKEIDSAIGINRVHDIIKQMINCPEFYIDSISFFESLIYWSRIDSDSKNWFMRIRAQARYEITSRVIHASGKIATILFPTEVMELMEHYTSGEEYDIDILISIKREIRKEICQYIELNAVKPILIVNDNEFNTAKLFMRQIISSLIICGYSDISSNELMSEPEMMKVELAA